LIKWKSPDRAEELIVAYNHNVINLYFTANKRTMYVYETMSKYSSVYDTVFTCLHNSSLRLICHFFLIPLRWRISQILLYNALKPEESQGYRRCLQLQWRQKH